MPDKWRSAEHKSSRPLAELYKLGIENVIRRLHLERIQIGGLYVYQSSPDEPKLALRDNFQTTTRSRRPVSDPNSDLTI